MRKEEVLEILQDWNFWKKELDSGKERTGYLETCLRLLKTNVVVALIGIRRSGKSYIMRQIIKKLIASGEERKNILLVNLEDRRFVQFYPKLLDEIYETYLEFLKPDKIPLVFMDEVHMVSQWERWVRTMHELGKAKIIVSGSSSKLLAGELATVLTGRHLDLFVFPLSFREFLHFKNLEIKDGLDIAAKKIEIKAAFSEYMEFGGFPEVVFSSEKKQLLLTYLDDIITKDIERRYRVKETEHLRALARFYLSNISNRITFNSITKFLDTTTATIEKFSSYMQEAHLIFFVKRFSFKVKEQEKAARKVYSADVGLANATGFKTGANLGKRAENIVATELKKREKRDPHVEIYYWHDLQEREVDFVVKKGTRIEQLIQVCWDLEEYTTRERELKALLKASEELRCEKLFIITGEKEGEEIIHGKKINYVPLWRWLLGIRME